jgi:hypothetical protein
VSDTGHVTVLFDRFFDDAAIFPPGNAPMEAAVREHVAALESPIGHHLGPFVCSASRLVGLGETMTAQGVDELDLTLVAPVGSAAAAISAADGDSRLRLRAVEISGDESGARLPVVPAGTRLVVERPVQPPFDLPEGATLKLRTGGESSGDFPDENRLAAALRAALDQGLAVKLTAGLHNAVRHADPVTGFEHHGFLNVILAVHVALSGAGGLAAVLAEQDASAVAAAIADLDEPARGLVRSRFLSFGTCSITEPIDDLRGLQLLEEAA